MRLVGIVSSTALLIAGLAGSVGAQASSDVIKIGILTDQNGIYSYVAGRGTVEAARLAVEDVGGKVLGKPIEILTGDDQNKPDIGGAIARKWIDQENVNVILAGTGSASTVAILNVVKDKDRTLLVAGAGSSDITGKLCSHNTTQWAYDTYGVASSVAKAVVEQGGKDWFFIAADYSFGQALTRDTTRFIEAGGGKVVGTARHPLGSTDFASYLMAARSSGASVVGLANAGGDTVTAVKQAHEFGLAQGGQRLAGLLLFVNDIQALSLNTAQQTLGAASFYHDLNDDTKAWTKRYMERFPGNNLPNMNHAAAYAAVRHYLKAVEATGTEAAAAVGSKMRELPVNDFYNKDVRIRRDGRVLHDMMLWRVKTPAESKGTQDLFAILQTLPGNQVFRPENEGDCPLNK
jgi:branched-chain amino acid transport system substrate-binding protein